MIANVANFLWVVTTVANLAHWLAAGRPKGFLLGLWKIPTPLGTGVTLIYIALSVLKLLTLIPDQMFAAIAFCTMATVNLAAINYRRQTLRSVQPQ